MGLREARSLSATRPGRLLLLAAATLAVATVGGLVALWPPADPPRARTSTAMGGRTVAAEVLREQQVDCGGPVRQRCRRLLVSVDGGPGATPITIGPVSATPSIGAGTKIRVSRVVLPAGARLPADSERWAFVGIDRRGALLWLGAALGLLALIVLRWRGLLAVLGVGVSLLLVTTFMVPAILAGTSALLVALVGSLAVMFVTLVLTNGVGAQSLAAALGIGSTLVAIGLVALLAIHLAHLDGHSGEVATYLGQQEAGLSLSGIVLAGMVIGALGVLTDTAVTQASAVMALRRADPRLSARRLYGAALAVGRDHLSATIHTLVLAYVGAALPLLLVLRASGVAATDALNAQDIAEPIVATLVGCIGLVAAVPLTTTLAAILIARIPAADIPDGHGHAH
jgi:uncharacterized membrane protein